MGSTESVKIEQRHGFLWVIFPAAVTVDNYRLIEDKVGARLSGNADKVVLDLALTENIYSSGIGLVVRLKKQVCDAGGALSVVNVSRKIREVFEGMHLEKVLPLYTTDVEFEISHDEAWNETLSAAHVGFVFTARIENGVYHLSFAGNMDALHDLSEVSEFKPTENVSHYVVNLENLDVMDTYGSQLFLEVLQRIARRGGKCITCGANEMIRELMKLLCVDRLTEHFDTEKQALASLKS